MLLALAIAAPLAAQQPDTAKAAMPMGLPGGMGHGMMQGQMGGMQQPGMMGHMMEMMGPMMRSMAFAPDHLLGHKEPLNLTPQQLTRLTALRDAAKKTHDAAQADMQAHMGELAKAMEATSPDTAQVKMHFQAAQAAMGRAHWAMLSAAAQARAMLTDAQRGRVEGWVDMMQEHQGQMMPMMQMRMQQHPSAPEH
jgi:hypothetical protein